MLAFHNGTVSVEREQEQKNITEDGRMKAVYIFEGWRVFDWRVTRK